MTHLDSLYLRLSNERMRLANAKTESERRLRTAWVRQIEREIEHEEKYEDISIDELAQELADYDKA